IVEYLSKADLVETKFCTEDPCRDKSMTSSSDSEDEEFGDPNHLIGECSKPPKNNDQREFIGGAWRDNGEDEGKRLKTKLVL
ncbi:hypothetical protein Tco_0381142, partial [Tanacetum coccineum]